ncbi:MAG: flagellar basal body P-ring protein FlgI [Burkholderiaceae bacterium]|nr:flagellar basal body P-ring protein FlgI [Burkholderiaceae bacterium]
MKNIKKLILVLLLGALLGYQAVSHGAVDTQANPARLKDIGRVEGWRSNQLVGYGLVAGLAGTGDSSRNKATRQSIANTLSQFDVTLALDDIQSRNVAAVMVTASLPAVASVGDRLDVSVTSMGDARSLVGGVLLMAPLKGPDGKVYALSQGALSVGGYRYDANGNVVQKNHPTVGTVPNGANVEVAINADVLQGNGTVRFLLSDPDYTTANRAAQAINQQFGAGMATPLDGGRIEILVPRGSGSRQLVSFLTQLENVMVDPDRRARVVINERTGTVVAGSDVRISRVSISHGDLKISIVQDQIIAQPVFVRGGRVDIYPQVAPTTRISAQEEEAVSIQSPSSNSVADLITALAKMKVSPRDMISILQGLKTAGALRAELIIQ